MNVIEHVVASREPPKGYRDPLAKVGGVLVAEAKRADASRRWPWAFAAVAVVTGGLAVGARSHDPFAFSGFALGALTLLFGLASARAWERVLGRLRLEVRDGRLTARTGHVWQETTSLAVEHVVGIEVVDASTKSPGREHAALAVRLSRDRVVPLLEPLSPEDAETLRELAASAIGLSPE